MLAPESSTADNMLLGNILLSLFTLISVLDKYILFDFGSISTLLMSLLDPSSSHSSLSTGRIGVDGLCFFKIDLGVDGGVV